MSQLTDLITELVRIDSINPVLDPSREGEGRIARFVESWAQERGLETRWLEGIPGRPSVIVRAPGTGGGRSLLLNAHLDTVGVTGMEQPFEPRIEGSRMYGRGVMDMKASIAACLLTAAWAREQSLAGDVIFTAVADEEHGSIGTEEVMGQVRASAAIVTEPTDLELHVAHRGFALFEVSFTGKASHTSRPHEGVNALAHLGRFLGELERQAQALQERYPHPLLAHGSLQPVLAQGGEELFTTPARARVPVERRTLPGETSATARAEIDAILGSLQDAEASLDATVTELVAREPFETQGSEALVATIEAVVRGKRGREPAKLGAPYWTDAALVAAAGVPTVLFGPRGGEIHGTGEWLDLDSAHEYLEMLKAVCSAFCG